MRKSFIVAGLLATVGLVAGCSGSGDGHDRQASVRQEPGSIPGNSGIGMQPGRPTLTGGGQSGAVVPSAGGSASGRLSDPTTEASARQEPGSIPGSSGMGLQPGGYPTLTGGGQSGAVAPSAGSQPAHGGNRNPVTGTQEK